VAPGEELRDPPPFSSGGVAAGDLEPTDDRALTQGDVGHQLPDS
jgi:hypothetical protein